MTEPVPLLHRLRIGQSTGVMEEPAAAVPGSADPVEDDQLAPAMKYLSKTGRQNGQGTGLPSCLRVREFYGPCLFHRPPFSCPEDRRYRLCP